jgi:hypothetical protein
MASTLLCFVFGTPWFEISILRPGIITELISLFSWAPRGKSEVCGWKLPWPDLNYLFRKAGRTHEILKCRGPRSQPGTTDPKYEWKKLDYSVR